ncbi:MAG: lysyl-tRNA synthetase class 2, partial [Myxococcota bacterium]
MYSFDPEWLQKLTTLRDAGIEPYPNGLVVTHISTELHTAWPDANVDPTGTEWEEVAVGGRVMFRNRFGKAMFLRLQDRGEPGVQTTDKDGNPVERGGVIQVYVRREEVGDETFAMLRKIDIGDFLWARGGLMRTRTRELTLQATEAKLAAKILTPFPDRWHGVADIQTRSRQRYVDLFINAESRDTFRKRSKVIRHVRRFFEDREFLEVETPMMQPIPGGAAARPFVTHHNALGMDLYLRIAPELYLKRLVVGGFERVFEINRNFRNEGVSTRHNPEFTMLEFYMAWATHADLMDLTEMLLRGLAEAVTGGLQVEFAGRTIDFGSPFRRADMDELIAEHTDLTLEQLQDPEAMATWWRANHRVGEGEALPTVRGKWWERLFDAHVEQHLWNPTFVTGFPTEISPLSRRNDASPDRV